MNAPRLLVVDDDTALLDSLRLALSRRGFEVITASESGAAAQIIEDGKPIDLIVLDVMMPGMNGVTLCRLLRNQTSLPILILSARDAPADKVEGLRSGADDYLAKPFDLDELVARIIALLRRALGAGRGDRGIHEYGGLHLDSAAWTASQDGSPLTLTRTEFRLLALLMTTPEAVCTRDDLVRGVWSEGFLESDSNSLEVHIANLRHKLEERGQPRVVQTVRGVGYVLKV